MGTYKVVEALIEQVVEGVYAAAASFMGPQIAAESTATARWQAYLRSNIAYIAAHRMQMMALLEIVLNVRTEDGQRRYHPGAEEPDLEALQGCCKVGNSKRQSRNAGGGQPPAGARGVLASSPFPAAAGGNKDFATALRFPQQTLAFSQEM